MDDVFAFLQNADEQLEKHGNAIEAATKVRSFQKLSLRLVSDEQLLNILSENRIPYPLYCVDHFLLLPSITKQSI